MRLALWGAFLVWLACSDSDQVVQRPTLPEQGRRRVQPPVSGVQTPTGTVHTIEVRAGGGRYRFLPASLTIKQGDTVRWVAYDSPPHNVAFFHDRIPANSAAALQGIMPGAGKNWRRHSCLTRETPTKSSSPTFPPDSTPTGANVTRYRT